MDQVETIGRINKEEKGIISDGYLSGLTKDDRLKPVITVTIYWGYETWDAPTTLQGMMDGLDDDISPYVDDIDINLFSIMEASKEKLGAFQTRLGKLFRILATRNNDEEMQRIAGSDDYYKNVDIDTARMISELSQIKMPRKQKKGGFNMCKAVIELREKGRQEGREEGRRQEGISMQSSLIEKLLELGRQDDAIRVCREPKYREKLYKEFGITAEVPV